MHCLFWLILLSSVARGEDEQDDVAYRVSPALKSGSPAPPCWLDIEPGVVAIHFDKSFILDHNILISGRTLITRLYDYYTLTIYPSFINRLLYKCRATTFSALFNPNVTDCFPNATWTCFDYFDNCPAFSDKIPLSCFNSTYIFFNETTPQQCVGPTNCTALLTTVCQNHTSPVNGVCSALIACLDGTFICNVTCRCAFFQPTSAPTPPTNSPTGSRTRAPTRSPTPVPTNFPTSQPTAEVPTVPSGVSNEGIIILLVVASAFFIFVLFIILLCVMRNRRGFSYRV